MRRCKAVFWLGLVTALAVGLTATMSGRAEAFTRHIHQGIFQYATGRVVPGGTVTVYLENSTTLAVIYDQETGGSAVEGSQVTSGNDGHYYFFIDEADYDSDQRFKVVLSKTGYTSQTYDYLEIIPPPSTGGGGGTSTSFEDDAQLTFGDSDNFAWMYNSTSGNFELVNAADSVLAWFTTTGAVGTASIPDPSMDLYDSNAAGTDRADEKVGSFTGGFSDTTEDAEISDWALSSLGAGTAGTEYSNLFWDGSDAHLYMGVLADYTGENPSVTPLDVANYESLAWDFDYGVDTVRLYSPVSGTTHIYAPDLDFTIDDMVVGGDVSLGDDGQAVFGDDDDFAWTYNSTSGNFELVNSSGAVLTFFKPGGGGASSKGIYTYYPDADETDQGTTGTGDSVADIIAAHGETNEAVLSFQHTSTGANTTYTWSTTDTIPGNYTALLDSGVILQIDSGVDLTTLAGIIGQPGSKILVKGEFYIGAGDGIVIDGVEFAGDSFGGDGNLINITNASTNTEIKNCYLHDAKKNGVYADSTPSGINIHDNRIEDIGATDCVPNTDGKAIYLIETPDVRIHDNYITRTRGYGAINCQYEVDNIMINNNRIENTYWSGISVYGSDLNGYCTNVTISNNYLSELGGYLPLDQGYTSEPAGGIYCLAAHPEDVLIIGNKVRNSANPAIEGNITVIGNIVDTTGYRSGEGLEIISYNGIYLANKGKAIGNYVINAYGSGIGSGATDDKSEVVIRDNTVIDSSQGIARYGIQVQAENGGSYSNTTVADNVIIENSANSNYGLGVFASGTGTFSDTYVYDNVIIGSFLTGEKVIDDSIIQKCNESDAFEFNRPDENEIALRTTTEGAGGYAGIGFYSPIGGTDTRQAYLRWDDEKDYMHIYTADSGEYHNTTGGVAIGDGLAGSPNALLHIHTNTPTTSEAHNSNKLVIDAVPDTVANEGRMVGMTMMLGSAADAHDQNQHSAGIFAVSESAYSNEVGLAFYTRDSSGEEPYFRETMRLSGAGELSILGEAVGHSEDEIEAYIFDADAEEISANWEIQDNINLSWGDDDDFSLRMNTTSGNWELVNASNSVLWWVTPAGGTGSITTANPYASFYDSDAAGTARDDEFAGMLTYGLSTTTEDGEISDWALTSMGAATAGTEYSNLFWDGSDAQLYMGILADYTGANPSVPPLDVAGYESLVWDFDYGSDEIHISSPVSGTTKLSTSLEFEAAGSLGVAEESPTTVVEGESYGEIRFEGYHDGEWLLGGVFRAMVDDSVGSTNEIPTRIEIATTKDGEITPTEAVQIDSEQNTTLYGELAIEEETPIIRLNDETTGQTADAFIKNTAADDDDAVMTLGVDDSSDDDTTYVELDGVNEQIELKKKTQIGTTWLFSSVTTLSTAQVNALRATPITLVAAQGANTIIELVSAILTYDYATAAFTVGGDEDLVIEYADGTDTTASIETTGFLDQADDEVRFYPSSLAAGADLEASINQALQIFNTGTGELSDGGGEVDVRVTYRVYETGF